MCVWAFAPALTGGSEIVAVVLPVISAVAVMGTSGYCGLLRQKKRKQRVKKGFTHTLLSQDISER